jgi:hypothetical protein
MKSMQTAVVEGSQLDQVSNDACRAHALNPRVEAISLPLVPLRIWSTSVSERRIQSDFDNARVQKSKLERQQFAISIAWCA